MNQNVSVVRGRGPPLGHQHDLKLRPPQIPHKVWLRGTLGRAAHGDLGPRGSKGGRVKMKLPIKQLKASHGRRTLAASSWQTANPGVQVRARLCPVDRDPECHAPPASEGCRKHPKADNLQKEVWGQDTSLRFGQKKPQQRLQSCHWTPGGALHILLLRAHPGFLQELQATG